MFVVVTTCFSRSAAWLLAIILNLPFEEKFLNSDQATPMRVPLSMMTTGKA